MKKAIISHLLCISALVLMLFCLPTAAASAKTYTISPNSKPCNGISSRYNSHTKGYYLISSYLNKIASEKGGTLVLKKGTYKISNTLYVSSNTHIKLQDGVVLKKETTTGVSEMPAASSMFQFINADKAQKKGAYGKHNGEKNISITGSGTAVIDLGYADMAGKDVIGIIMGHNQNITLKNVTFKNMRYGHMIEMDSCKNVTIKNCTFTGFKPSGKSNKEAINLDTPDKNRSGFKSIWSKMDGTPNENVKITDCTFKNLEAGIGTHRYTGDKYHTGVTIKNCKFEKVETAIRVLNWKNAVITKNSFKNCKPNTRYPYSFFIAGAKGINFSKNTFYNCGGSGKYLLEFWCDRGYGAGQDTYAATTSKISEEEAELFLTNKAENCGSIHVLSCSYNVDFTKTDNDDNDKNNNKNTDNSKDKNTDNTKDDTMDYDDEEDYDSEDDDKNLEEEYFDDSEDDFYDYDE